MIRSSGWAFFAAVWAVLCIDLQTSGAQPQVFSGDVAALLARKCLTCHNAEKKKGGYRLDTYEWLLKPGESGKLPITPGAPEKSHLYQLITATDPDDRMPQKDEPLPRPDIQLLRDWIAGGALCDGSASNAPLASLASASAITQTPRQYHFAPPVLALAFSPNGETIAATGYGEVTLWDSSDGHLRGRLEGLPQRIQALAYHPEGALMVCGGTPGVAGEVTIIDDPAHPRKRTFARAADVLLDGAFSPDGKRLAIAGSDNSIRIYSFPEGKELSVIQQHADWVNAVVFSHDGKQLASASRDRTCRVFDALSGELETTYTGHESPVQAITFSSDDKLLCSAARDRKIHIWERKDAKKTAEISGLKSETQRLDCHEKGLFVCGSDKTIREFNLKGEEQRTFSGHHDWIYALTFDSQGKRMATGSFDGEVRVWDSESGKVLVAFRAAPGLATDLRTEAK